MLSALGLPCTAEAILSAIELGAEHGRADGAVRLGGETLLLLEWDGGYYHQSERVAGDVAKTQRLLGYDSAVVVRVRSGNAAPLPPLEPAIVVSVATANPALAVAALAPQLALQLPEPYTSRLLVAASGKIQKLDKAIDKAWKEVDINAEKSVASTERWKAYNQRNARDRDDAAAMLQECERAWSELHPFYCAHTAGLDSPDGSMAEEELAEELGLPENWREQYEERAEALAALEATLAPVAARVAKVASDRVAAGKVTDAAVRAKGGKGKGFSHPNADPSTAGSAVDGDHLSKGPRGSAAVKAGKKQNDWKPLTQEGATHCVRNGYWWGRCLAKGCGEEAAVASKTEGRQHSWCKRTDTSATRPMGKFVPLSRAEMKQRGFLSEVEEKGKGV
mmetsp:Transcript_16432/g.41980  ORF Transcript_16432/g.41980 Transcript_16432/m.41980 type:complete len:393 (+) Transcript_16432:1451-2629(+)